MTLTFATLLWIVVSAVEVEGVCHQTTTDSKEFDTSVQSKPISKCRVMPRRLKVFESITEPADQQHTDFSISIDYGEDSHSLEDDKTINEILQHSLVELSDTLRTLESNNPSNAMRIPLHLITVQSSESLMVFQSLLMMLSNPKESRLPKPWQKYLIESIRKQQCPETDLCREFSRNFKCDEDGHLGAIVFDNRDQFVMEHLNLRMIPNTVEVLSLRGIGLKTISDWTHLKDKSLKALRVDANNDLELNLDGLIGESNYLPLEHMTVRASSIIDYFGEGNRERLLPRIGEWMRKSTLITLKFSYKRLSGSRQVYFARDGSWTLK